MTARVKERPEPQESTRLITCQELARRLGAAQSSVLKWASEGLLPVPVKIGGAVRWHVSEVEEAIAAFPRVGYSSEAYAPKERKRRSAKREAAE